MKIIIKISVILFVIVACTTIYIICTTKFINKDDYREIAWHYVNHSKAVINYKNGKVDLVKLQSSKNVSPYPYNSKLIKYYKLFMINGKISRVLLKLNGNYAVKVTFKTNMDLSIGPITIYINPFTKQIIGEDMRY